MYNYVCFKIGHNHFAHTRPTIRLLQASQSHNDRASLVTRPPPPPPPPPRGREVGPGYEARTGHTINVQDCGTNIYMYMYVNCTAFQFTIHRLIQHPLMVEICIVTDHSL